MKGSPVWRSPPPHTSTARRLRRWPSPQDLSCSSRKGRERSYARPSLVRGWVFTPGARPRRDHGRDFSPIQGTNGPAHHGASPGLRRPRSQLPLQARPCSLRRKSTPASRSRQEKPRVLGCITYASEGKSRERRTGGLLSCTHGTLLSRRAWPGMAGPLPGLEPTHDELRRERERLGAPVAGMEHNQINVRESGLDANQVLAPAHRVAAQRSDVPRHAGQSSHPSSPNCRAAWSSISANVVEYTISAPGIRRSSLGVGSRGQPMECRTARSPAPSGGETRANLISGKGRPTWAVRHGELKMSTAPNCSRVNNPHGPAPPPWSPDAPPRPTREPGEPQVAVLRVMPHAASRRYRSLSAHWGRGPAGTTANDPSRIGDGRTDRRGSRGRGPRRVARRSARPLRRLRVRPRGGVRAGLGSEDARDRGASSARAADPREPSG